MVRKTSSGDLAVGVGMRDGELADSPAVQARGGGPGRGRAVGQGALQLMDFKGTAGEVTSQC